MGHLCSNPQAGLELTLNNWDLTAYSIRPLSAANSANGSCWKLNLWEVSTAYPLVFRIAASDAPAEVKSKLYDLIYSYLVRRALCGLTPKNLNKTFARLTRELIEHGVSVEAFSSAFANQKGDTVRFPNDAELRQAIRSQPVYHTLSRKDRLAELLWDLECGTRTKFNVNSPRPPFMSVEHVLPQTWTPHWPLRDGRTAPPDKFTGADETMLSEIRSRDAVLHRHPWRREDVMVPIPGNAPVAGADQIIRGMQESLRSRPPALRP